MNTVRKIFLAAVAANIIAQRNIVARLRGIGLGIGLFIISGALGLLGVVGGIFSIFFSLAHVDGFVMPSLIAGGISMLLAIIIGIEGKRLMQGK